jgi:hypothetical protein
VPTKNRARCVLILVPVLMKLVYSYDVNHV